MQQVSLPFALASALLGLAALQCGPPVAQRPPPTPVYTSELSVPPTDITQESLGDPADESKPEASPTPDPGSESESGCECQKADPPPAEDETTKTNETTKTTKANQTTEPASAPMDAKSAAPPARPGVTAPLPR